MPHDIWLAQQNADLTEGRGPMVTKGAFTRQEDATRAAQDLSGVMGVGHGEVSMMKVFTSYAEWSGERNADIRRRALNKLSREEKRALGVED